MNLSFTGKTSLLNNQENPQKKPQKDKKLIFQNYGYKVRFSSSNYSSELQYQIGFCTQSLLDVSMAEWSKAPDSSSGLRKGAWVRTPLLTERDQVIYTSQLLFGRFHLLEHLGLRAFSWEFTSPHALLRFFDE